MITHLQTPKTHAYMEFKNEVLGDTFPWNYQQFTCSDSTFETNIWGDTDTSWFSKGIIGRPIPGALYSLPDSNEQFVSLLSKVVTEILTYNQIDCNCILRACLNLTIPQEEKFSWSPKHTDHTFPHKNLLVYLKTCTNGGEFRVWENQWDGDIEEPKWGEFETFKPKEDYAISFDGLHYHAAQSPTSPGETRVALVVTYI